MSSYDLDVACEDNKFCLKVITRVATVREFLVLGIARRHSRWAMS